VRGYSLQANRKTREGADHPDRDAQFAHINETETVKAQITAGQPVISVDTKKRELVGHFKAVGRGCVGISRDTSTFAVKSILSWWEHLGKVRYPNAKTLMITADCGGSNSSRTKLWKVELQRLADAIGLEIIVCHFPPGTSKWNKIEHRLFSFISTNWRGKPLISHEVIINLIAGTTTTSGLTVYAQLDEREYPKGIEVTDEQLAAVNINRETFHGDWNYRITPSETKS